MTKIEWTDADDLLDGREWNEMPAAKGAEAWGLLTRWKHDRHALSVSGRSVSKGVFRPKHPSKGVFRPKKPMRIERTIGMIDSIPCCHLVAYDKHGNVLIALPCHPRQPSRWWMGKASKTERRYVLRTIKD